MNLKKYFRYCLLSPHARDRHIYEDDLEEIKSLHEEFDRAISEVDATLMAQFHVELSLALLKGHCSNYSSYLKFSNIFWTSLAPGRTIANTSARFLESFENAHEHVQKITEEHGFPIKRYALHAAQRYLKQTSSIRHFELFNVSQGNEDLIIVRGRVKQESNTTMKTTAEVLQLHAHND